MPVSAALIGMISYGAGAIAFLALTVPLLLSWKGRLQGGLLLLACLATLLWTAATAYAYWAGPAFGLLSSALETLRTLSWIAFLWSTLRARDSSEGAKEPRPLLVLGLLIVATLAIEVLRRLLMGLETVLPDFLLHLAFAIIGLVLTENLFRNTPADHRWHIKFLCLSTGALFTFDLFLYGQAALLDALHPGLFAARGLVQAMVAPLLAVAAVRNRIWSTNITVSRHVVLHSTTLIAGGIYLLVMAAAAYYLRELGEMWGPFVQIIFLVGAVLVLAIIFMSGTTQAYLRVFISKHFYAHRYDYRKEWLRFMGTLAADQDTAPLEQRVIKGIADILDSPGGAIWLAEGARFRLAAARSLAVPGDLEPARDSPLPTFLEAKEWVLEIGPAGTGAEETEIDPVPEALKKIERAWLIVPLCHHVLIGFVVLERPRAPRPVDWEDHDILKTAGRQAASYLAEQRAARALAETEEFDRFSREFAFVVHDIKNLVSQLSLVVANYDKFGQDKAFRDDMIATVKDAVATMKRMMDRVDTGMTRPSAEPILIKPLIDGVLAAQNHTTVRLSFQCEDAGLAVAVDRDRLAAVLGHLIRNATEAVGEDGIVTVSASPQDQSAVIDVADNGPGMTSEFIRNELFTPFRSTKKQGVGIGAYQCRQFAEALGGSLEVLSGESGTTFRMSLPSAETGLTPDLPAAAAVRR